MITEHNKYFLSEYLWKQILFHNFFPIDIEAFYFTLKKGARFIYLLWSYPIYFLFIYNNKYKCWAFLFIFHRLTWRQNIDILYSIKSQFFKIQFKLPVKKSKKSIRIYNKNAHLIFCQVITLLFVLLSMYLL